LCFRFGLDESLVEAAKKRDDAVNKANESVSSALVQMSQPYTREEYSKLVDTVFEEAKFSQIQLCLFDDLFGKPEKGAEVDLKELCE
jgi:hypothetical protein